MRTRSRRTSAASGESWSVWVSNCRSWAVHAGAYRSDAGGSVTEVGRGSGPAASRREQSGAGGTGGVTWGPSEADAAAGTARGRSCSGGRDGPAEGWSEPGARWAARRRSAPGAVAAGATGTCGAGAHEAARGRSRSGGRDGPAEGWSEPGARWVARRRSAPGAVAAGGHGYVRSRCPRGGARPVLLRWARWPGGGSVRTRRQMGGTQTLRTRRRGRGGRGYMRSRCPRGGARPVLLRRARWPGGGSVRTRRQMGGTQAIMTRGPPPRRRGRGDPVPVGVARPPVSAGVVPRRLPTGITGGAPVSSRIRQPPSLGTHWRRRRKRNGGVSLTPRPPLQHLERGSPVSVIAAQAAIQRGRLWQRRGRSVVARCSGDVAWLAIGQQSRGPL